MKTELTSIVFTLSLLSAFFVQAQSVTGFWKVTQVTVGDEVMTPVAKWFKINENGTYQAGNGWLQNGVGIWTYHQQDQSFLPEETNGIKEEFGAFTVSFSDNEMVWKREEEGMPVIVTLKKITQMPQSTADKLVGLWDLTKAYQGDQNITTSFDPNHQHYLFIRWDRVYVERTPEGARTTGYWHINGHRPEMTLLSDDENREDKSWEVLVTDTTLTMIGISEANQETKLIYHRIHEFPK